MNLETLYAHLDLELAGEPFSNPELEARRQAYINSICSLILENS